MKHIALIGMPNTGKSTFFNRLTGASAKVGNWPGVTVDLMSAKILAGGQMAELVDLPGLYDLRGFSDDEKVVRHFIEQQPVDLVIVLINACQLERQLSLLLQLKALNMPCVLLLNMADEARKMGITVDTEKMSALLNMPVVLVSAKYGERQPEAMQAINQALAGSRPVPLDAIRQALTVEDQVEASVDEIIRQTTHIPMSLPKSFTDRLDKMMLHPLLGLPLFFLVMFLVFCGVFWLGTPLQEGATFLFDYAKEHAIEPMLASASPLVRGLLVEGIWGGVGTVAAFVPVVILFFLFMAVVEDTGYLSRAAFLTDALMARLGLDGRAFVMFLMGFGCNVPAVMGTRVMRARSLRLLSMLTIPFSLCSARLQVFLFIITALFSPKQAPFILLSLYIASFASAILTAWLFKGKLLSTEPFVIELPPYRLPTVRQVLVRGWLEARHFLRRATKIIIAGVVFVWFLSNLPLGVTPSSPESYAGWIGRALDPVLSPIGVDEKLAVALIVGFVAKEVVIGALAVIYGVASDASSSYLVGHMDWVQAFSFMLFTLIYTPCLATIATLRSEARSVRFAIGSVCWSVLLAWCASFVFYQTARALGA